MKKLKHKEAKEGKSLFALIVEARNKQISKGYTPDSDRQQYRIGQLAGIGFDIIKGRNNNNAIHNHLNNKYIDDRLSQDELFAHAIALMIADYEAFGIGAPMSWESLDVDSEPDIVYRAEVGGTQTGSLSTDRMPPFDEDPIIADLVRTICNDGSPYLREMREYISGLNEPFLEEETEEVKLMLLECSNTFGIIRHARSFSLTSSATEQIIARTISILSGREASETQPF